MNWLKKSIEKGRMSAVYRIFLVVLDACCVNLCAFLALFIRYELNWERFLKSGIAADYTMGYVATIKEIALFNTIIALAIFALFRMYNSLWRYASINEFINIMISVFLSTAAYFLLIFGTYRRLPRSYFVIYAFLLLCFTVASRFSYRFLRQLYNSRVHGVGMRNTMIIGAGEAGNVVINELKMSTNLDSNICCIIDDNKAKHKTYIKGVKVIGGRECIADAVKKYNINEIIIAMPSAPKKDIKEIIEICQEVSVAQIKILPGVYQFVTGEAVVEKLRHVEIEDLLGREPVKTNLESVMSYVKNKVVLVTGGGGSIGSELCRQIAANKPKLLIIFDIYENNAYDIQQELLSKYPNMHLEVLIGSVRNTSRIDDVFKTFKPEIVYHAAAHKHVPLMEDSPNEAIKNNVFGTYKVALAAGKYNASKFVLISTDKAVNPTNIMGASKRICEMIIQGLDKRSNTDYVAVRFGNVLGSNGSVIPLFKKQIEAGGPVTVTDKRIIRYFMTIPEAVSLVLQAGVYAKGGEIFVLDMGEPVKIDDLARNLIRLSGYVPDEDIEIVYTGLRPGEKLYEEMLMDEENLKQTENELIHIGRPIEFDEEAFFDGLDDLYKAAYNEVCDMKEIVAKIVPTYHYKKSKKDDVKMSQNMVRFYETSRKENVK
ncbi:polysaccharide biosynthesis protein [Eubacterium xylanophilum]|uniref:polysaccharide biosynthesis protein n=1 Tax=Eubacterium xylanophilum TaxID=39497 RepID=UPI0004AD1919|nr:nucleoside-diphosphate sugar epimerase/dehydratase [Eubacterium xylanophilum]